jgi:hypothetical protein
MATFKIKARDGNTYDVKTAAPGEAHEVRRDGTVVGSFVLKPEETVISLVGTLADEALIDDIAERFVGLGGVPMGIA